MLSETMRNGLKSASMIRKMFEEGNRLKSLYGAENVYDFSLGNPDADPPKQVLETMKKLIDEPGIHKYMPNAGWPDVRATLAERLKSESGVKFTADNIIMTVGAAGALNTILHTILDPGDEVIVLSPYFVEYLTYIKNHNGIPVIASTTKDTFQPDINTISKVINKRTKGIILNTPNNPTGVIYTEEILKKLSALLTAKEKEFGIEICIISDQPYDKLIFIDGNLPSISAIFPHSIAVNSYSKSLALPGERIGWLAVNPAIEETEMLMAALTVSNRSLGFVNAPSLFQKTIARCLDVVVDADIYRRRRDNLYDILISFNFKCVKPDGAFYLFPKCPIDDDIAFAAAAAKYNLLLVPGSAFGCPGYFRLAYCVGEDVIERSKTAFEKIAREFNLI